jgi:hypothetical protein
MKQFFGIVAVNLFSIICVLIAGYMVYNGNENWGWFLVVGLVTVSSPKSLKV